MRRSSLAILALAAAFLGGYQLQWAQITLPVKAKSKSKEELRRPDQKEAAEREEIKKQEARPLPEVRVIVPRYRPVERVVSEPILTALEEETARAKGLRMGGLDQPYYLQALAEDSESFSVSAMLGALVSQERNHVRPLRVQIRLGSTLQDNGNSIYSDYFQGTRYDSGSLPLDDDFLVLKHYSWLAIDRAYKTALEAIARKRAILRAITRTEVLPDFSPASPVKLVLKTEKLKVDEAAWTNRVRVLSEAFSSYADVFDSNVSFEAVQSTTYLITSEGTQVKMPEGLAILRGFASTQAADGMPVYDGLSLARLRVADMPSDAELRASVEDFARNVSALAAAPVSEGYVGPVLFEPAAAGQAMAEVFATQLAGIRRPVAEPGRNVPIAGSELDGRLGSRVLPEWIDLLDDPTRKDFNGRPLLGSYPVDLEGVVPTPVTLVEKGVFKSYLMTRVPVRGQESSNGRARLPGPFLTSIPRISNLFVRTSRSDSLSALRQQLLDMIRQQNKPFGLLIRKMDFPSAGSVDDLRRLTNRLARAGGGRVVSSPVLVYRVYPDGREQLVRGLRFRAFSARSFKDILAASNELAVFDYLDNGAPMALPGAGQFAVGCSVVSPALLFEDLELEAGDGDQPSRPLVPPPPLTSRVGPGGR
jgi:hypothetical protein